MASAVGDDKSMLKREQGRERLCSAGNFRVGDAFPWTTGIIWNSRGGIMGGRKECIPGLGNGNHKNTEERWQLMSVLSFLLGKGDPMSQFCWDSPSLCLLPLVSLISWIVSHKDVYVPIFRTHEFVTLHGKRYFKAVNYIRDLEMERLSWISWMGPVQSQECFWKGGKRIRVSSRRCGDEAWCWRDERRGHKPRNAGSF